MHAPDTRRSRADDSDEPETSLHDEIRDIHGFILRNDGRTEFRMPSGPTEANAVLGFILSALAALVAPDSTSGKIVFVGAKAAAGYVGTVSASRLLSTALADMLDAIGDTEYNAARRALDLARMATLEAESQHQLAAAKGFLQLSYERWRAATESRSEDTADLHAKATRAALIIAAIESRMGHDAARYWADKAKHHFHTYAELERDSAQARYKAVTDMPINMAQGGIHSGRGFLQKATFGLLGYAAGGTWYAIRIGPVWSKLTSVEAQLSSEQEGLELFLARISLFEEADR